MTVRSYKIGMKLITNINKYFLYYITLNWFITVSSLKLLIFNFYDGQNIINILVLFPKHYSNFLFNV